MAFVDGILVAQHFSDEGEGVTQATESSVSNWTSFFSGEEDLSEIPEQTDTIKSTELEQVSQVEVSQPIVPEEPEQIFKTVPFTTQAPVGAWASNPWNQMAEEAVILMAQAWSQGESELAPSRAVDELLAMAEWEKAKWGSYGDNTAQQILEIFQEFYGNQKSYLSNDLTLLNEEVQNGSLIILLVRGEKLNNPYYSDPAPENHILLLTDYIESSDSFLAHDPGTSRGRSFEYTKETLLTSAQNTSYIVIRP